MSKSLLEQLPKIVYVGKRQAERILEGLEARTRVGLQSGELVVPAKDTNWQEFQSHTQKPTAVCERARWRATFCDITENPAEIRKLACN